MSCPKEFTCSLFADGELPEVEAREVALHLESCNTCERLIESFRAESRMLVQCLQDVDIEEAGEVPEFATTSSEGISALKFTLGIIGTAVAFKVSTAILNLPSEFGLNFREWVLSLGVAINAGLYALQNADAVVGDAVQAVFLVSLGSAVLFAMSRLARRGTAVGSLLGVLVAMFLVSSPSYAVDLRKGAAASIPATEIVDDTVVAGPDEKVQNIDVAGTIKGDLFVVGDVVTITGTVEGNVIAVARRIEISGTVGGSLMGAAHTVVVSGRVGRNMITGGDAITVSKGAEIAGNAITASREAVIDGKTERDLLSASAILDVRGEVGRHCVLRGRAG